MKHQFSVSDSEWEVLKTIWKTGDHIRQPELLKVCEQDGREWKRQTLNTFLVRLENKELIKRENGFVSPIYSEEEFCLGQMKENLDKMYQGKLGKFIAAFSKSERLSKEDEEALRELLK